VDTTRSQRRRKTKEHLEKRFGERCVDSEFQKQLKDYGSGSTKQSWTERSIAEA